MRNDLKEVREKLGLTQAQVATAANVSLSTISRLESGGIPKVSNRIARQLATAYGLTFEEILAPKATAATS